MIIIMLRWSHLGLKLSNVSFTVQKMFQIGKNLFKKLNKVLKADIIYDKEQSDIWTSVV